MLRREVSLPPGVESARPRLPAPPLTPAASRSRHTRNLSQRHRCTHSGRIPMDSPRLMACPRHGREAPQSHLTSLLLRVSAVEIVFSLDIVCRGSCCLPLSPPARKMTRTLHLRPTSMSACHALPGQWPCDPCHSGRAAGPDHKEIRGDKKINKFSRSHRRGYYPTHFTVNYFHIISGGQWDRHRFAVC